MTMLSTFFAVGPGRGEGLSLPTRCRWLAKTRLLRSDSLHASYSLYCLFYGAFTRLVGYGVRILRSIYIVWLALNIGHEVGFTGDIQVSWIGTFG
jgi:hypothetical protein